jgi:antibiotic biosynthesis monooxygenase (ABM) superfamily enzyme
MKPTAIKILAILFSTLFNFFLFVFVYNTLATPHLHEAQRAANADFIMTYALGGFFIVSILSTMFTLWLSSRSATKHPD